MSFFYFALALVSMAATGARLQQLRMYPAMRLLGGIGGLMAVLFMALPFSPAHKGQLYFFEKALLLVSFPLCLFFTRELDSPRS